MLLDSKVEECDVILITFFSKQLLKAHIAQLVSKIVLKLLKAQ